MAATDRRTAEQLFHDSQAGARARDFSRKPATLCFTDDEYLDHETWIRPAFEQLGSVRGLNVLDFGCGHGMAAVVLARAGARVTAFDLSGGYIGEAHRRAFANQVDIDFVQADGERLPFADSSFNRIWGNAVLHHLNVDVAARELHRVLCPGGLAVFCEPWGENALLNWARGRMPYPGKQRTADESPLRAEHVRVLETIFPRVDSRGFQLLAMARRLIGSGKVSESLDRCDRSLFAHFPGLQRYCRYILLTLRR
ncbi:MAG TPA: class I SAM-dependent methyltransferase [Gemmataceae bacterium]|nr:class I SAM-dependent methyltransferase [Gemmataceae bacterium]